MFGVDIDQTIATGYIGKNVQECRAYYQHQGITVPESAQTYVEIFGLPEVIRVHEELPGAVAGVQWLAKRGPVGYFTVRKPELQQNTCDWLREHHFPEPQNVTFCVSMVQKLLKMQDVPSQERLFLIEDHWQKVLVALQFIEEKDPLVATRIRDRLTLVAFGATAVDVPSKAPVCIVPLPAWAYLEEVFQCHLLPHRHTQSKS